MPTIERFGLDALDYIMMMISTVIKQMESEGIFQWNMDYPGRELVQKDIANGTLWGLRSREQILGIVTLNEEQPMEYMDVPWRIQNGSILVIHRLAVHPDSQHQGIARKLLDHAEKYALEKEYCSIRLDAYSANPRALGLYERRGYLRVGEVRFPSRSHPFYCYEKLLRSDSQ